MRVHCRKPIMQNLRSTSSSPSPTYERHNARINLTCMKRRPFYNLAVLVWSHRQLLRIHVLASCTSYSWIFRIFCISRNRCVTRLRGVPLHITGHSRQCVVDPVGGLTWLLQSNLFLWPATGQNRGIDPWPVILSHGPKDR